MSAPEILCLGEAMVEFVRAEDGLWRQGFGGDTSNAAIAAARQGASVGYVSAVGRDPFGDALLDLWAREGVDAGNVLRAAAPTGIYFVDPDPEARRFTYYRAGSAASALRPADLDRSQIAAARLLHVSGITFAVSDCLRAAAFAAMQMAAEVSLDTNLRLKLWSKDAARDTLSRALEQADHLITSIEDWRSLWPETSPDDIIDRAQAAGARSVLVTMGERGCRMAAGETRVSIDPAPADPVDSTGAGDSFAGAYHAWRLELGDPIEAARRAAIVAAGTVSGFGAIDPIPYRKDVLARL